MGDQIGAGIGIEIQHLGRHSKRLNRLLEISGPEQLKERPGINAERAEIGLIKKFPVRESVRSAGDTESIAKQEVAVAADLHAGFDRLLKAQHLSPF